MVSDELLKTLAEDGCQSNGPPVVQACDFIFLRYGHNGVDSFHHTTSC